MSLPSPVSGHAGVTLAKIEHLQPSLPPTAKRIASFIRLNTAAVLYMSITELAEQTAASEGSIVGFCRRVGATGFAELKILLAKEQVEPIRLIQEDLSETDDPPTVADHVFAAHAAALADTRKLLSAADLTLACDLLCAAARIEIYGIGSSAPIAQDFAYRLLQIGLDARAIVDSHVQAVSASKTGPNVTTVTVSHSGSTIETVTATRYAKAAGARTIGITRMGNTPLKSHCELVLHTAAKETLFRPEATSSRMAQLAIIDTLVSCCAIKNPQRAIASLEASARVIAEKRY